MLDGSRCSEEGADQQKCQCNQELKNERARSKISITHKWRISREYKQKHCHHLKNPWYAAR
jgi:hypothetical protein